MLNFVVFAYNNRFKLSVLATSIVIMKGLLTKSRCLRHWHFLLPIDVPRGFDTITELELRYSTNESTIPLNYLLYFENTGRTQSRSWFSFTT